MFILPHFFGDWAKEMMEPITEQITPGTKVLDSKLGVRADQFQNPSFILSLNGKATETNGEVLAGSLAWSGSFQCEFDDNGQGIRALCGINPFASAYHLKPNETFVTPMMIWVWSDQGLGDMSRKLHDWARDFGMRDGHQPRPVLLNNWEATGFNFDFNRSSSLFDPGEGDRNGVIPAGRRLVRQQISARQRRCRAWRLAAQSPSAFRTVWRRWRLKPSNADCVSASGWSRKW